MGGAVYFRLSQGVGIIGGFGVSAHSLLLSFNQSIKRYTLLPITHNGKSPARKLSMGRTDYCELHGNPIDISLTRISGFLQRDNAHHFQSPASPCPSYFWQRVSKAGFSMPHAQDMSCNTGARRTTLMKDLIARPYKFTLSSLSLDPCRHP